MKFLIFGVWLHIIRPTPCMVNTFGVPINDMKLFRVGSMNSVPDFEETTKCTTFVDKTELISKFFINSGYRQYHLITCPRKFGKTLNLDMIRKFVQINATAERSGQSTPKNESAAYKLFTGDDPSLKIGTLLHINVKLNDHFQAYSMIHVTFKDLWGHTEEKAMNSMSENIKKTFESYRWLYEDLRKIKTYPYVKFMKKILDEDINEDDIIHSLSTLASILSDYFPRHSVFVIIDDYDSPVLNAIEYNFNATRFANLIQQMFYQLFLNNHRHIRYALITGTVNILERNKFSTIKHWNFLENHFFAPYFGFSQTEVNKLCTCHLVDDNEKLAIKAYYGGYNVSYTNLQLYNPYDIVNYICGRGPDNRYHFLQSFWIEVGVTPVMTQFYNLNQDCQELVYKLSKLESVTFALFKTMKITDIEAFRNLVHHRNPKLTDYLADLYLSYLYHNGFFCHGQDEDTYKLPNEEIKTYMNLSFTESDKDYVLYHDNIQLKLSPDYADEFQEEKMYRRRPASLISNTDYDSSSSEITSLLE